MANVYVNIIDEIEARLSYGQLSGSLKHFKHIGFVGQVRENKPRNEMPQIVLEFAGNTETKDVNSTTPLRGDLIIFLNVYIDLEDIRQDNVYYDSSEKGILYDYTYIMDTLYTKSDGSAVDCRLNGTLKEQMTSSIGNIEITDRSAKFVISLTMKTVNFAQNARNT